MKPPKTVRAVKKKPAKRNPIITKLLNLKYRINDAYRDENNTLCVDTLKREKSWVMERITELRNGVISLDKEDMITANEMWRKYEGN